MSGVCWWPPNRSVLRLPPIARPRSAPSSGMRSANPSSRTRGISFKLADMAVEISAARMMLYEAAKAYDAGRDVATLGAMAKLHASEVAHRAADTAVQIWGGLGYCKPTVVERLYRDQRILEVYEGSSEIQRLVLARAVRKEAEAAVAMRNRSGEAMSHLDHLAQRTGTNPLSTQLQLPILRRRVEIEILGKIVESLGVGAVGRAEAVLQIVRRGRLVIERRLDVGGLAREL